MSLENMSRENMSLDQKSPEQASHHGSADKLVYMANQIGKFFSSQGADVAVPGIADHIRKFWNPRMRQAIFAHLDHGAAGLDPDVRAALIRLKDAA